MKIKIPKAQTLLMRAYLQFNEGLEKHYGKTILLRDFIIYGLKEGFITQDSKGRYGCKDEVQFNFEASK